MNSWSFDAARHSSLAQQKKKENKKFIQSLKRLNPSKLDQLIHALHEDVFDEIDCLHCANCCRSLGPRLTERDISTLSKYLGIRANQFIDSYLRIDEDMDFVFKTMPCPFLGDDNYCRVYEARPKACREYPHTDRDKFYQLLDLSLKNAETCPAVLEIFERARSASR